MFEATALETSRHPFNSRKGLPRWQALIGRENKGAGTFTFVLFSDATFPTAEVRKGKILKPDFASETSCIKQSLEISKHNIGENLQNSTFPLRFAWDSQLDSIFYCFFKEILVLMDSREQENGLVI